MDEIDFATERAERFNALALQAVLQRVGTGRSSGICRSCDMPIEAERMAANPSASHCCDCAAEEEERSVKARRCGPR